MCEDKQDVNQNSLMILTGSTHASLSVYTPLSYQRFNHLPALFLNLQITINEALVLLCMPSGIINITNYV